MDWRVELRRALAVQDVDRQIDALQAERHALVQDPRDAEDRAALAARRARQAAREKALAEAERRQRLAELERQSQEAERQRSEQRLYGGGVSNPRDLEGLQKNIEGARARIDRAETEILEAMEAAEGLRDQIARGKAALTRAEREVAAYQQHKRERIAEIDAGLPTLAPLRQAAAAVVDPMVLREYERVRGRAQGIGVSAVEGGACGACGMEISPLLVAKLAQNTAAVVCEHCGRLLAG